MADPKRPADVKARILSHMNADHKESISLYLRHYCDTSEQEARTGELEDIGLDSILLRTYSSRYIVPIKPPMASLAESRTRLVQMDQEATEGLGLSKIVIDTYAPPTSFIHVFVFAAALFGYIINLTPANYRPGSWFADKILRRNRFLCRFLERAQPWILALMLVIHVTEVTILDRTRLRKHRIRRFGKLWFKWAVSNFIEGYGAFQRFDKLVEKKKAKEAMKQKH